METEEKKYDEIRSDTSIKQFFNEKYGEVVRVVTIDLGIDGVSEELCGGTHVLQTGELGLLQITKSQIIASGICRIEAVTGLAAETRIREQTMRSKRLVHAFKTQEEFLEEKALSALRKIKTLENEIKETKVLLFQSLTKEWIEKQKALSPFWKVFYHPLDPKWTSDMRSLSELVHREKRFDLVWLYTRKDGFIHSTLNTKHARAPFPSAKEILQKMPACCVGGGSNLLCQFVAPLDAFDELLSTLLSSLPTPPET
ncbi:Alanyl-tRNA synthetase [Candidatus Similichlamydia laticola]|uniref:Alanyl-tRNA synthetase n=1 Tax=Candidatus Similichlamydia laticola TaxID=2170265 RepID=A0A369KHR9_9BACT|nr:Alanyl-tRNA synthetase [Candidatus Similichlamydia laticola]